MIISIRNCDRIVNNFHRLTQLLIHMSLLRSIVNTTITINNHCPTSSIRFGVHIYADRFKFSHPKLSDHPFLLVDCVVCYSLFSCRLIYCSDILACCYSFCHCHGIASLFQFHIMLLNMFIMIPVQVSDRFISQLFKLKPVCKIVLMITINKNCFYN